MSDLESKTFRLTNYGKEIKADENAPYYKSVEYIFQDKGLTRNKEEYLTSSLPSETISPYLNHALVGVIYRGYSGHKKLVLRADDFWLSIIITFGNYINKHAEKYREFLVTHKGKKEAGINDVLNNTESVFVI